MSDSSRSIAQHYHERTKYDPRTIHSKRYTVDWNQQPSSFKVYQLGTAIDLKSALPPVADAIAGDPRYEWHRLSRLLLYTGGLTGVIETTGGPHYLRSTPSAGGLYPAEIYLISRGTPLLAAGVYNYQVLTHSLMPVWESQCWNRLQAACYWHPALENTQLALAVTAVFFRSAWRYHDRAYRRIFLDSGHLLGNLELAGATQDYRPHLIGSFADEAVNQVLYLDGKQEGAIAIVPLADLLDLQQNLPLSRTIVPAELHTQYPTIADEDLLAYFHQATQIPFDPTVKIDWKVGSEPSENVSNPPDQSDPLIDKYNFPFCLKVPTATSPISWGDQLEGLTTTILHRRSTRAYRGDAIKLEELKQLLDFTYHPEHYRDQGLDGSPDYFDLSLVETFLAVADVDGLDDGCYYYAPRAQELRQIRFKNFRRELHFLCLNQELGRDAAAVLFHTADLQRAIAQYGDRVYRSLHLDAGHLGQRLNLAAIQLGLGVSGIGGFFDDQVNEVLGIPIDEAVLYITTLGRPG